MGGRSQSLPQACASEEGIAPGYFPALPSDAHASVGSRGSVSRNSRREAIPSFANTFFRCHSTVRGLRNLALVARLAQTEHDRHRLREHPPRNESEHLRCGLVDPLQIVDDAGQRLLLSDLRHEGERGQSHEEAIGRRPRAGAQRDAQRIPLRRATRRFGRGTAPSGPRGTRTLNLRIKSPQLCRLS